jgi:uncharacterized protein YjbI with pentapeptide repeats
MSSAITFVCHLDVTLHAALIERCQRAAAQHAWSHEGLWLESRPSGEVHGSLKPFSGQVKQVVEGCRDVLALLEILQDTRESWTVLSEDKVSYISANGLDADTQQIREQLLQIATVKHVERLPWNVAATKTFSRAGAKALQKRWIGKPTNDSLQNSPFEHTATGNVDLRGIENTIKIQPNQRVKHVDFSFANIASAVNCEQFDDCIFDGAKLEHWRNVELSRCQVRGAAIESSTFTAESCDFSMAKFRSFIGIRLANHCTFDFASFKRASVYVVAPEVGKVDSSRFTSCSFQNASFEGTGLCEITFVDCDFTGAAFFDAYYVNAKFINCKGLDQDRMFATSQRSPIGGALCELEDIEVQKDLG